MEQRDIVVDHTCLEAYGEFRDTMTETVFLNTYGSPLLQAMVGLGVQQTAPQHASSATWSREAREAQLRAELGAALRSRANWKRRCCARWSTSVWRKAASTSAALRC